MPRPPLELSRRRALGALSVPVCIAAAGCLESLGFGDACSDPTHFSLQAVNEGSHATNEFCESVESLPHGTEPVVSAAMETGDATVRDYYAPELRKQYVVSGPTERFYRVTTTDSDPATVTGVEYAVEIETDGSAGDRVRAFDSLPERDRESIRRALGNEQLLDAPHYDSFSVVFAPEDAADRERSPFVPAADDVRVRWDDHLLRYAAAGTRSVTLTTTTIVAERVADSSRGFFEHVFDEHGVELDPLPDEQRSIVEEAIADGVTECPPHSAAFAGLVDRLLIADGETARLVGYDGNRYFTHISVSPDDLR